VHATFLSLPVFADAADGLKRPNIVLIFTDDQRHDAVGYSGNKVISTPNLDRLARQGVIFQNCFVNSSICALSRANILSGQYPARHGIDNFHKTFSKKQLSQSVPARLQAAGYQTSFFGKWGVGDTPKNTRLGASVFDYWAGQPMQTSYFHEPTCRYCTADGFDKSSDDLCNCPADSRGKAGFRNRIGKANLKDPLHVDADVIPLHVDRFLAGRDSSKPFCMMLFFKAPHSPFGDWDEETKSVTDKLVMPVPAESTLTNARREPEVVKRSLGRATGMRHLNRPKELDRHIRDYYRLITSMDMGVGKIVNSIKQHQLDDNTVYLFTSDNGHFFSEHGLAEKWLMYEPSLRVPGFMFDPRSSGGKVSDRQVITTDFSVTTLALAGLEVPENMTGRDLTTLYEDPSADWRSDFYYEHPYGHHGRIPRTVGVRDEKFVYTRYIDPKPNFEQLFDLATDPHQLRNLVDDAAHEKTLKRMRKRCGELAAEVGPK
jgi:arylsulfatase A-like enzyme